MEANKTVTLNSLKLDGEEINKLQQYIANNSIKTIDVTNQYELLRVKTDKYFFVLYKSGKIVLGNEATKMMLNNILSKMENYDYILGSDETGKGEWFGPLVTCCMALNSSQITEMRKLGIKDSKLFNKQAILELSEEIIKLHPLYKTRILMPDTYNRMYEEFKKEGKNLNDLLAWAHTSAIKDVLNMITYNKVRLVIDKFDEEKTYGRLLSIDKTKIELIQKSKGESETSVAAASIIAKRTFELCVDDLIKKYHVDLRNTTPSNVNKNDLKYLAKLHFKNVMSIQ